MKQTTTNKSNQMGQIITHPRDPASHKVVRKVRLRSLRGHINVANTLTHLENYKHQNGDESKRFPWALIELQHGLAGMIHL